MSIQAPSPLSNSLVKALRRLRLALITVALIVGFLLTTVSYLSYRRMSRESFLQQRFVSERFVAAMESALLKFIEQEELRPFDHYSFFTATTSEITKDQAVQRSPLANQNTSDSAPGVVGYFQIDPDGRFSSPLLPEPGSALGPSVVLSEAERVQRESSVYKLRSIVLQAQLGGPARTGERSRQIISSGALVHSDTSLPDSKEASSRHPDSIWEDKLSEQRSPTFNSVGKAQELIAGYDQRQLRAVQGQIKGEQSALDGYIEEGSANYKSRVGSARKEQSNSLVLKVPAAGSPITRDVSALDVISFEAEIDPLQARMIDNHHLLLFRKAWRNGRRYIQGVLVLQEAFIEAVVSDKVSESQMPRGTSITFIPEGGSVFGFEYVPPSSSLYGRSSKRIAASLVSRDYADSGASRPTSAILLYQATLGAPLDLYSIFVAVEQIPLPPGGGILALMTGVLGCVIAIGFFVLYRLGHQHITLAQKRLDFVSAVSHELKTPLTSIRMYSEMLKNDWAQNEEKRRSYYQYIFQESERLSRLISNVLQLSRISSKTESTPLETRSIEHTLRTIQAKVENIASGAGFTLLAIEPKTTASVVIQVDDDALAQIAINLVENAVKFSRHAERREVHIGFEYTPGSPDAVFFVRDFGPGIPRAERRKIFELFYRREDELTRQTQGTGIGLALVKELSRRMNATVDYRSKEPGSEFRIVFSAYFS